MTRIAMTFPKEFVNEFDECLRRMDINLRTKGMKDTMNEYIARH